MSALNMELRKMESGLMTKPSELCFHRLTVKVIRSQLTLQAQVGTYPEVLAELRAGRKRTHLVDSAED